MFRGSTLAASEWPAEKREEVQETRLLPARWTLFELIRQREGREGTSQVVVSTHPLPLPFQKWRIDGVLLVAGIEGLFDL